MKCFQSMKVWFQKNWGVIKRSQIYNVILALMASLPFVDIVTDYIFLGLTFSSEPNELEKYIAFVTLCSLYLSSRLVMTLVILTPAVEVTTFNMAFFYIPFSCVWQIEAFLNYKRSDSHAYDEKMENFYLFGRGEDLWDLMKDSTSLFRIIIYSLFLVLVPFIHFAYVLYCVYKQASLHLSLRRDFPPFIPLAFVEILESVPQAIFQTIIFWIENDLSFPWDARKTAYFFSMLASTASIVKAVWVYYLRFDIVKKGFSATRIDDLAYLKELLRNHDEERAAKVLERMINHGVDSNDCIEENGETVGTVLMYAAGCGCDFAVAKLVSLGADIEESDNVGKTALIYASEYGHETTVEKLISLRANIESRDEGGQTALMYACEHSRERTVEKLISLRADIESRDVCGLTALLHAAKSGHDLIIKKLVSSGANIRAIDKDGSTSLIHASQGGHYSIVEKLVLEGANIEGKDKYGRTALMHAAEGCHESTIEKIIDLDADIETKDKDGKTVLLRVAENGLESIFHKLVALGANIESKDEDDKTILMRFAETGHISAVMTLLSVGANVQSKNKDGKTILMCAAENGHDIKQLIASSADIEAKDKDGKTALMCAAENGHDLQQLIASSADIESKDKDGKTALMCAAENGHDLEQLIASSADIESKDKHGKTALIYAAENGNESTCHQLISSKADIESKDKFGKTPLMYASENGHDLTIIRSLISWSADIMSKDKAGSTAISYATSCGHQSIVEILISTLRRQEDLIVQGELGDKFLLIVEGRCDVLVDDALVGEVKEGAYIGELAMMVDAIKRAATIRAQVPTTCLSCARDAFVTNLLDLFSLKERNNIGKALAMKQKTTFAQALSVNGLTEKQVYILTSWISNLELFEALPRIYLENLVGYMTRSYIANGDIIIKQGDEDKEAFYVVEEGVLDIIIDGNEISQKKKGDCVGEMALMYDQRRNATVQASSDSVIWEMKCNLFRSVQQEFLKKTHQEKLHFLETVPEFSKMTEAEIGQLAAAFVRVEWPRGTIIFRQGEQTNDYSKFYVLREGSLKWSVDGMRDGLFTEPHIFGHLELENNEPRSATITCIAHCVIMEISRNEFNEVYKFSHVVLETPKFPPSTPPPTPPMSPSTKSWAPRQTYTKAILNDSSREAPLHQSTSVKAFNHT